MEIYSKNIAHIRGFGSWCWITGGFGPCEASLRAPDLGGGVGGGPVEDHLQAATDQDGREAREEVRRASLDGLAGVHGQAPGQLLDLVDRHGVPAAQGLGHDGEEGDVGGPAQTVIIHILKVLYFWG